MNEDDNIEISSQQDEGDETCLDKLSQAKEKLKACEREKSEYLDGWQRSKADYANFKREVSEREKDLQTRLVHGVINDLVPVLESMEHARAHTKDLEPIENQLVSILKIHGLELIGQVGEAFEPDRHEAIGIIEVAVSEQENIIKELVTSGYSLSGKILKAAKVKISKHV